MCLQSIKRTVTQYGCSQNNIGHRWMDVTSFTATRIIWSHNTKPVGVSMCKTCIIWSGNIKLWCLCLCATLFDVRHLSVHYKAARYCEHVSARARKTHIGHCTVKSEDTNASVSRRRATCIVYLDNTKPVFVCTCVFLRNWGASNNKAFSRWVMTGRQAHTHIHTDAHMQAFC